MIYKANKVRDKFHREKIQINTDALCLLNEEIMRLINKKIDKCKFNNIKRLTSDLCHYTK